LQVVWSGVSFNPVTWTPSHFIILSQCKNIECLLKYYNFVCFLLCAPITDLRRLFGK
jgi:hypothetical protein